MYSEYYSGVILAGGLNSRYDGLDKAFIKVDKIPIIDRILDTFSNFFSEIIIVSNRIDSYPEKYHSYTLTSDYYQKIGPLGGIHAAMKASSKENLFIVSCDMPWISIEALSYLLTQHQSIKNDVALIPSINNKLEPLHAIYKTVFLNKLEEHIENQEKRSIQSFLEKINTVIESSPELLKNVKSFTNINSPEDFNKYMAFSE